MPEDDKLKKGRTTAMAKVEYKATIDVALVEGLSEQEIYALRDKHTHRLMGQPRTIRKWIDEIRTEDLAKDPQWFNRARTARISAEKRLRGQIKRFYFIIHSTPGLTWSAKEILYTESLLTKAVKELYLIESDFDPEQYYKEIIRQREDELVVEKQQRKEESLPRQSP